MKSEYLRFSIMAFLAALIPEVIEAFMAVGGVAEAVGGAATAGDVLTSLAEATEEAGIAMPEDIATELKEISAVDESKLQGFEKDVFNTRKRRVVSKLKNTKIEDGGNLFEDIHGEHFKNSGVDAKEFHQGTDNMTLRKFERAGPVAKKNMIDEFAAGSAEFAQVGEFNPVLDFVEENLGGEELAVVEEAIDTDNIGFLQQLRGKLGEGAGAVKAFITENASTIGTGALVAGGTAQLVQSLNTAKKSPELKDLIPDSLEDLTKAQLENIMRRVESRKDKLEKSGVNVTQKVGPTNVTVVSSSPFSLPTLTDLRGTGAQRLIEAEKSKLGDLSGIIKKSEKIVSDVAELFPEGIFKTAAKAMKVKGKGLADEKGVLGVVVDNLKNLLEHKKEISAVLDSLKNEGVAAGIGTALRAAIDSKTKNISKQLSEVNEQIQVQERMADKLSSDIEMKGKKMTAAGEKAVSNGLLGVEKGTGKTITVGGRKGPMTVNVLISADKVRQKVL